MNIKECREKCYDNGIYQLNQGETLADALRYIEKGGSRKGYKIKDDYGRLLTDNEVIEIENKIAFLKSFTPAIFKKEEVESINDITGELDLREDKTKRGLILCCYYCGDCMRVDADASDACEDYGVPVGTLHCHDCFSDAIAKLAM